MKTPVKVSKRLVGFIAKIQAETNAEYTKRYTCLTPPNIVAEEGSKFWKIVKVETDRVGTVGGRSVHSFVEKATGDIYRAATWRAPAKHVRGNIFDANFSFGKGVTLYGGAYLV